MHRTASLIFFLAALVGLGCGDGNSGGSGSGGAGGNGGSGGSGGSGGAGGAGGSGGADPFAECDGKNYMGVIHSPADGATGVPLDAKVSIEFTPTGIVPDRYLDITDATGGIPVYKTSGFDGTSEWTQYDFLPNTKYSVEIGWMCVLQIAGETQSKKFPLAKASFTTAP